MTSKETLQLIQHSVHQVLPDAKVLLFGSRANDTANEESDWDILVIAKTSVSTTLKDKVHDMLYPMSVRLFAFFHLIIVSEAEWNENPSYYSLKQSILSNPVLA